MGKKCVQFACLHIVTRYLLTALLALIPPASLFTKLFFIAIAHT